MRSSAFAITLFVGLSCSAQETDPKNAFGVSLVASFLPQAQVSVISGDAHALFPFTTGFSGALSYRRWLDMNWSLTGTVRADRLGYYLLRSGNMEPLDHWASSDGSPVGLPPEELFFMGIRADLARVIRRSDHWALRAETGIEVLFPPTKYHGFVQRATVNEQDVPDAMVVTSVVNEDGGPVGRMRLAMVGAYTDRRKNEWSLTIAGKLAVRKDLLTGTYAVQGPDGMHRGSFNATLNAIEVIVGRYFSWGQPKLPRWAREAQGGRCIRRRVVHSQL